MPVSRRTYDDLHARYEEQVEKTTTAEKDRAGAVSLAARTQRHHDALALVVAAHIVSAEDNDEEISPAALRAAVQRARIDLSLAFARFEGRDGDQQ